MLAHQALLLAAFARGARAFSAPAASCTRFLLCRHGETSWNSEGRIQGSLNSDLTEIGLSQVAGLGWHVATSGVVSEVDHVYCSPAGRACQSLASVVGVCDAAGTPLPKAEVRADFREIDFFEWEGRTKAEIAQSEPERWAAWKATPWEVTLESGKAPLRELWRRANANWRLLREAHPDGDTVLVMAHGALGKCMLCAALGLEPAAYADGDRFGFDNADMVEIEWPSGASTATRWRRRWRSASAWQSAEQTQAGEAVVAADGGAALVAGASSENI